MRRRDLLATVSALAVSGAAGCTGRAADSTPNSDDSPPGSDTPPGTTPSTAGGACPSFVDDADRTVCYRDRGSAAVYLRPSSHEFQDHDANGEVETLTLTLHNGSDRAFRFNPYDWAVARRTDGGWVHVAPDEVPEPLASVDPGGTYEWVLSSESHPSNDAANTRQVVVEGLRSGYTHAFRVHGYLGEATDGPHVECVAVFDYVRSAP